MPTISDPTLGDGRRLLERCSLFRGLADDTRRQLAAHAHRRRFAQGDVIFRIGSAGQSMMAVLAGSVRITVPSPQGKEIVLADIEAGQVFGEIALLDGKERTADAVAVTSCELLVLERRDLLPFIREHPEVGQKLLEVLCDRLRRADEHLTEIAFLELPVRLAKALLRTTSDPATSGTARRSTKLSLSQRELANMIGGARESVNRCLGQWQDRGIIRLDKGWIYILSRDALKEIADPR